MSFHVIAPPTDEAKFAEVAKEILEDAARLGMNLEPQGFLYAWATNTRVAVEKQDGVVVSMAMLINGMQWTRNLETATVLEIRGNIEPMLEFVKTLAIAMGARVLMVERPEVLPDILNKVGAVVMQTKGEVKATSAFNAIIESDYPQHRFFNIVELTL